MDNHSVNKKLRKYKRSQNLSHLLNENEWKYIGRCEMVLDLTDFQFSTTEIEALSQRQKFASAIRKNITTNTILSNYRNCDTDFSKDFIQGIILTSVSQPNDSSLPKRYIQAQSNLTKNPNIIISPADKIGDVVIMHRDT